MNFEELLYLLENPQVYTGREINAVHKPVEDIRSKRLINVCLIFPDVYEIGMSHQGLIILYHLLNNMPHVNAERCFLPPKQSIEVFKSRQIPLFSLESRTALKDFDLIGFSLLSEMNYTNVLQILDLAQIPLLSKDRDNEGDSLPVIAAGGISVVNPEPLRDYIDVFAIGDGEDIFPDLIEALEKKRKERLPRQDFLQYLNSIESLYIPALYPPVKKGRFYAPDLPFGHIKKRVKAKLEDYCIPEQDAWIVPITNVVFNRLTVEIARGCPKNCRFCQAKSYYAPYRIRPLEKATRHIESGLKATGFECFSLSALSTGDYPELSRLLKSIPDLIPNGVVFSLPSLRPSTLSDHILSTIARYKRTGITIVPEAGTQRLRQVINKDVTDEEIYRAVDLALKNRWQKIKLYFMLGLPTETMEDIDGIIDTIKNIRRMSKEARQKIQIHASFSPFVPKPNTPLQWAARAGLEEIDAKVKYLREQLRPLGQRYLDLDYHTPFNSMVETILARGDYRVGQLLMKAFEAGEIFSAWDRDFHFTVWKDLIEEGGYDDFLKEIPIDEPLPWDFIQVNFSGEHLKKEYRSALAGEPTPACDQMECGSCQGCASKMNRSALKPPESSEPDDSGQLEREEDKSPVPGTTELNYRKVRILYEKNSPFNCLSHLSMIKYLERLIRKAGIDFRNTEGFTPRIKMSTLPALPVFASSTCEVMEFYAEKSLSEDEILSRLQQAGSGVDFSFKAVMPAEELPVLSKDIHFIDYAIKSDKETIQQNLEEVRAHMMESEQLQMEDEMIYISIDYSQNGQERFAKIYKSLDPEKRGTMNLKRTGVRFKSVKNEL